MTCKCSTRRRLLEKVHFFKLKNKILFRIILNFENLMKIFTKKFRRKIWFGPLPVISVRNFGTKLSGSVRVWTLGSWFVKKIRTEPNISILKVLASHESHQKCFLFRISDALKLKKKNLLNVSNLLDSQIRNKIDTAV